MAWLDDRLWCHPKIMNVPRETRWEYAAAVTYSSGFGTGGHLTAGQLAIIECTSDDRELLIKAGLWDDDGHGGIRIHDWDEHNGKRDARRASDRERKRLARAKEKEESAGRAADRTLDGEADSHMDGSALKEVKEVKEVTAAEDQNTRSFSLSGVAAAEPVREQDVIAACERFGADWKIAERWLRQLTRGDLSVIVEKMEMKIRRGTVESVPAQFVDLAKRRLRDLERDAAASVRIPTLTEEVLADAKSYAVNHQPWDVAEDLLRRKLGRRTASHEFVTSVMVEARQVYEECAA